MRCRFGFLGVMSEISDERLRFDGEDTVNGRGEGVSWHRVSWFTVSRNDMGERRIRCRFVFRGVMSEMSEGSDERLRFDILDIVNGAGEEASGRLLSWYKSPI